MRLISLYVSVIIIIIIIITIVVILSAVSPETHLIICIYEHNNVMSKNVVLPDFC